MPPKKRPVNIKANSVEESVEDAGVQPAKIRNIKKNGTEKQDEAVANIKPIKPKEKKKAEPKKKENVDALVPKNVVKKRGAHLPSGDFVDSDTESEEPDTKKKRLVKKEKDQSVDENSIKDKVEEEKKPKKGEKKAKASKEEKEVREKVGKNTKETKAEKKETGTKAEKEETDKKTSKKTSQKKDGKSKPEKEEKVTKKEKLAKKEPAKKKAAITEEKKTSNNTVTDWKEIIFDTEKKNQDGEVPNLKITSWNVDGLRAWLKKDGMNIFEYCSPDILCLQETKCNEESIPAELADLEGYEKFWCSSNKNGYAGVALLTKKKPLKVIYGIDNEDQDEDGRCITVEFDRFYLVTVYVPNAGRKLVTLDKRLDWNEAFKIFIKKLDSEKPVIICGDMNVAHNEIDLTNPKTNTKNAGFSKEEREGMTDFLEEGFVDTFRALYPDKKDSYTFWTYMMNARKRNIGWRLDYFLVSERLNNKVCDNVIHDKVLGSDHCPVTLFMNI